MHTRSMSKFLYYLETRPCPLSTCIQVEDLPQMLFISGICFHSFLTSIFKKPSTCPSWSRWLTMRNIFSKKEEASKNSQKWQFKTSRISLPWDSTLKKLSSSLILSIWEPYIPMSADFSVTLTWAPSRLFLDLILAIAVEEPLTLQSKLPLACHPAFPISLETKISHASFLVESIKILTLEWLEMFVIK